MVLSSKWLPVWQQVVRKAAYQLQGWEQYSPHPHLISLLLFTLSVVKGCAQTKAQYDTVVCKTECIDKYIEEKTTSGKIRYYAIYNDTKNDISELIPVSPSVLSYIRMCEANKIKPSLGIKLKNGQISSIIRFKNKYIRKWAKRFCL